MQKVHNLTRGKFFRIAYKKECIMSLPIQKLHEDAYTQLTDYYADLSLPMNLLRHI
jgi:hypothetical protein